MSEGIWEAAEAGDLAEVQRLVGHDPGLLNAMASEEGHVGVVRWLLDHGAPVNHQGDFEGTALWYASCYGHAPVARLLLERGADPAIVDAEGATPLLIASSNGHLEFVRVLLGHPSGRATIDDRDEDGQTALLGACFSGYTGIARALLESGADPTIAHNDGTTPMAYAKQDPDPYRDDISAEGRRECVVALEVSF
jgi:ankyrin repeat protein